jgi:hypothetical protein
MVAVLVAFTSVQHRSGAPPATPPLAPFDVVRRVEVQLAVGPGHPSAGSRPRRPGGAVASGTPGPGHRRRPPRSSRAPVGRGERQWPLGEGLFRVEPHQTASSATGSAGRPRPRVCVGIGPCPRAQGAAAFTPRDRPRIDAHLRGSQAGVRGPTEGTAVVSGGQNGLPRLLTAAETAAPVDVIAEDLRQRFEAAKVSFLIVDLTGPWRGCRPPLRRPAGSRSGSRCTAASTRR